MLWSAFQDPEVDEVLVNGTVGAWVVARGQLSPIPMPFADADALVDWLLDFAVAAGVRLDPALGAAGGQWSADGEEFRWHAVLPPLSRDGPLFSLRRHRFAALTLAHFAGNATLFERLRAIAASRQHLLIAGPTASGKTTLMAALLRAVAPDERIVTVEALAELPLLSPYCVRLVARAPNLEGRGAVTLDRLISEALRLRPDRLVVGEIRAGEAAAFLAAAEAGHGGVMATIHAATPEAALARLCRLAGGRSRDGPPLAVAVLERGCPPRLVSVAGTE